MWLDGKVLEVEFLVVFLMGPLKLSVVIQNSRYYVIQNDQLGRTLVFEIPL